MPIVVGVAFKPVTKVYYFDPQGMDDLRPGDNVVVETSRGRTLGNVVFAPRMVPDAEISGALKPVVRKATPWDLVQNDQMAHREPEALEICRKRAKASGLPVKIVRVEFNFEGSSALVYFTSEQRVDFRNLVHELSQVLHARVEMRQVGVRDEAKFLDGLGRCGRELCCASWLREFAPISIKMAKTQDLPLNAPEVSGVCGRLLCCLGYENDFYTEARRQMPHINSIVMTPQGPGKVKQVHVLINSVTVQVEGPNDTRVMVDVVVPEPQFSLSMETHSAEMSDHQRLSSEPLDQEATREDEAAPVGKAAAEDRPEASAPEVSPTTRRSRGRRRRR